uniref:Uncharacterized protein n=1 Tax=Rhizophora mucronata TaxID=61149 RepID=A0A2P2QLL8_RHIMU
MQICGFLFWGSLAEAHACLKVSKIGGENGREKEGVFPLVLFPLGDTRNFHEAKLRYC